MTVIVFRYSIKRKRREIMKIIRSRDGARLMVMICSEAERAMLETLVKRGLNTWQMAPAQMLELHNEVVKPLKVVEKVDISG